MRNLVFDIGGTAVKYGITENGALLWDDAFPTCGGMGADALMDRVRDVVREVRSREDFRAIGISTRGQVDCDACTILYDPPEYIPGYTGTDLREALSAFALPVAADNDVNCMALAEGRDLALGRAGDVLCLTFGTCIGGAILRDGRVYHGANWSAGEFGMMLRGGTYYEKRASVTALVEAAQAVDPDLADGRAVAAALERPEVAAVFRDWAAEAAEGLASLIHIFDPAALILGGGFPEDPRVFEALKAKTLALLAPGFTPVILPARYGNRAGLLGAGILAEAAKE